MWSLCLQLLFFRLRWLIISDNVIAKTRWTVSFRLWAEKIKIALRLLCLLTLFWFSDRDWNIKFVNLNLRFRLIWLNLFVTALIRLSFAFWSWHMVLLILNYTFLEFYDFLKVLLSLIWLCKLLWKWILKLIYRLVLFWRWLWLLKWNLLLSLSYWVLQ